MLVMNAVPAMVTRCTAASHSTPSAPDLHRLDFRRERVNSSAVALKMI
jgi:hypothetical protein